MPDRPVIFISYSRKDNEFVESLSNDLKTHGFEPWVDRHAIQPGQNWSKEIEQAIDYCQALLVVLSPNSVESDYVRREYAYALSERKHVIPVLYKTVRLPWDLRQIEYADFQNDYTSGLLSLVSALNRHKPPSVPSSTTGPLKFEPFPTTPDPPKQHVDDIISHFPKSSQPNTLRDLARFRREFPPDTDSSSSPQTDSQDLAPLSSKNTGAFGDDNWELEEEGIIIWFFAFCLLIGVSVAIGILTKSWQWSLPATLVTAVAIYLLGYRKGMNVFVMAGIAVISFGIMFALLLFLKLPDYTTGKSATLSLFGNTLQTKIFVGRQIDFALITGLACGIIAFITGLPDLVEGLVIAFWTGGKFALLLWGILFLVGTYFNWGFGYGEGWWLSLIMLAVGIIAGVGIAASFGICFGAFIEAFIEAFMEWLDKVWG